MTTPSTQPTEARNDDHGGRRRAIQVVVAVVVVAAAAALLWFFVLRGNEKASAATAPPAPPPVPVHVYTVVPKDVPVSRQFIGTTAASQRVEIRARVEGFLQKRAFEEGSFVDKGDLLFEIDARTFQAELEVVKARLDEARAHVERAQRQVERLQGAGEAASGEELDQWQTELKAAQADVALEQARLQQAQLDLDYTTVSAPIAGLIGRAQQDVGSLVQPSAPSSLLAVVQQIDPIYALFSVSEQELLHWRALVESGQVVLTDPSGLPAELELANGSRFPQPGRIDFLDVDVDRSTGSALVRAVFDNPDRVLRPGQFVHVVVSGAVRRNAILVPQKAVQQTPEGARVYVVGDDSKAELRPVELGEWQGDMWMVDGLEPAERIIVDHLVTMHPGAEVEVLPDGSAPGDTSDPAGDPPGRPR